MKERTLLIVALVLLYFYSFSQDPSYFVLGASEFKNAEIYSVLHTGNQKLYITTDKGLYQYKHGRMLQIEKAKEQRDVSLFNLIENSKNEVFCFNLNGQIFKIEDNTLKLYFQLPEKFFRENMEMFFDDIDRLIVSSGGCFAISDSGFEKIFYSENHEDLKLSKLINGDIILSVSFLDTIIKISNGKAIKMHSDLYDSSNHGRFHIVELNNKAITTATVYQLSQKIIKERSSREFHQYYQISDNEIWGRSTINGIKVFKSRRDSIFIDNNLFSNTFISSFTKDKDGTIFLGTFGKGLFVIPSRKTETYNNIIAGNNFKCITADRHNIYISDLVEGIYVYDHNKNKADLIIEKKINKVFLFKKNKNDFFEKYPRLFHSHSLTIGSGDVKNIFELDSSTYLMASSNGLLKMGKASSIGQNLWRKANFEPNSDIYISKLFTKRCTDVVYDPKGKALYVSTMSFLKALKPSNEISELSYKGFPIIANDLLFEDGLLWCATQNFGILVFKDNEIVKQINTNSGLNNNYVFKFEKKSDRLYISHKTGFQIYSIATQEWITIGTAEGIENGTVKDFCIQDDKIWFISNNQIISYALDNINSSKPQMSIAYDSIKVNDALISPIKVGSFKYYENNLAIYPTFSGLLYESEVKLEYILENTENNQVSQRKSLSITDDLIEFKYLPSGKYKFYIAAEYRGTESFSENYHFTINKAYWETTWFLIVCTFTIIALLSIFYKYRTRKIHLENLEKLEKQTLKTETIKAELKALRSQMNPHFIFNSLNSIQDLILKEDTEASYDYLVLFSELVRNALVYSNQNLISIKKEILFLQTYLKLEKLRFGSEFEFHISNKAPNRFVIPSLVIQPFVENAIAHGIFHKKGEKIIDIKLFANEENLVCTIQDNGMGREYSKKVRARSSKKHKSFALDAILKRLQFLKVEYGSNIGFEIKDIIENEGLIGTKVIVRLPLIEKKIEN